MSETEAKARRKKTITDKWVRAEIGFEPDDWELLKAELEKIGAVIDFESIKSYNKPE